MKKSVKSIALVLIALLACLGTSALALGNANIPAATSDFYVNDFAGIFSTEEKTLLMNNAISLADDHSGIQVVITTITSLEGDTVENYAVNMYNQYGIGKDDMGLLILLSTEDRQIRVETGLAMEAYINDSKAGRFMQEYAIPYLKENKFSQGIISLQEALISEIVTCVNAESTPAIKSSTSSSTNHESNLSFFIALALIAILLFIVLVCYVINLIIKKVNKRKEIISNLTNQIAKLEEEKENMKSQQQEESNTLSHQISELKREKNYLQSEYDEVKKKLHNLNDRYQRVLKIYPDADSKVDDMITAEIIEKDKQAARAVDYEISRIINLPASKDIVDKLRAIASKYSSLTKSQKQYIKSDIEKLNNLYKESVLLREEYEDMLEKERIRRLTEQRKNRAKEVSGKILAIISLITVPGANHLSDLRNARQLYDNLDSETRQYVDTTIISRLDNLLAQAKRDKRRIEYEQEEEERRRRLNSYNSSSSFNNHNHFGGFGGFGGRSGGGGASARF